MDEKHHDTLNASFHKAFGSNTFSITLGIVFIFQTIRLNPILLH